MSASLRGFFALCALPALMWSSTAHAAGPSFGTLPTITTAPIHIGDTVTCAGSATGNGTVTYAYKWKQQNNSSGSFSDITGETASTYTLDVNDLQSGDTLRCEISATDNDGTTKKDTDDSGAGGDEAVVDAVPVAVVTLTSTGTEAADNFSCAHTYNDPDGDTEAASLVKWFVNGTVVAAANTTGTAATASTSTGLALGAVKTDEVTCKVTPKNSVATGSQVTSSGITLTDSAPVATVSLTSTSTGVDDTLTCTHTYSDDDGDTETASLIKWFVDGSVVTSANTTGTAGPATTTGTTLSATKTQVVTCKITPKNAAATGTQVTSSGITLTNSTPTATAITLDDTTPKFADTMTCNYTYADADTDAESGSSTRWFVNATTAATDTSATSASPSTRTPSALGAVKGDVVTCKVKASDGTATASSFAAGTNSATVANTAPTSGSATISPAGPGIEDTVTCAVGSTAFTDVDTADTSFTYTYEFFKNTSTSLGTASSTATLDLGTVTVAKTDTIHCDVVANDGTDNSTAVSSSTVTVSNSAPTTGDIVVTPASPNNDSTMTCKVLAANPAADVDGDDIDLTFEFYVSDASGNVSGSALSTKTVTQTTTGTATFDLSTLGTLLVPETYVTCQVSATDGTATTVATPAAGTQLINRSPDTPTVTFTGGDTSTTGKVGQTITCAGTATDSDSETPTVSYAWTTAGASATTAALPLTASNTDYPGTISCAATADDGHTSNATATASATFTMVNSVPSVTAGLGPASPSSNSKLTCTVDAFSDADDHSLTYSYVFFNQTDNTTMQTFAAQAGTTRTYQLTGGDAGPTDVVRCDIVASDSHDTGTDSSGTLTIGATAPTISTPSLTPSSGVKSNTELTCVSTVTDTDSDLSTVDFVWTVGSTSGTTLTGSTETTVGSAYTSKMQLTTSTVAPGNAVYCIVEAEDAQAQTSTDNSTLNVENRAPDITTAAAVTSTTPNTGDTITCSGAASDPDGQGTPTETFEWTNGATTLGTSASLTISDTDTDPGDSITCTATYTDTNHAAEGNGVSTTNVNATIANSAPIVASVAVTPGSPNTTSLLSCAVTASDVDVTGLTYAFVWKRNGTTVSTTSAQSGSTDTYQLSTSNSAPQDVFVCEATASDGTLSDSGTGTVTLGNQAPVVASVTGAPSPLSSNDNYTCVVAATDPDAGSLTYSISIVNTTTSTSLNTSTASTSSTLSTTLTPSLVQPGDVVTCSADVSDGISTSSGSGTLTVQNTDPVVTKPTLSPSTGVRTLDTVTCAATATDIDDDGSGAPTVSYAWKNVTTSTTIGTGASITLTASLVSPGDTLRCGATATDALNSSQTHLRNEDLTIENTPPTVTASLSATAPLVKDNLTVSCATADDDGGTPSEVYSWSGSITGALSATTATLTDLSTYSLQKTEVVTGTCTVSDTDGGSATDSTTATIDNTAPTITVAVSPTTGVTVTSTVSCSSTEDDDDDADVSGLTVTYAWESRNGSTTTALGTGASIDLSTTAVAAGDDIYCIGTVTDPDGLTGSDEQKVPISNSKPVISTAPTFSATAAPSTALTCTVNGSDFSDADDGTLAASYTFDFTIYEDGVSVSTGSSTVVGSLGASHTYTTGIGTADSVWKCEVTIDDGGSTDSLSDASSTEFLVCYSDTDEDGFGDPDALTQAAATTDSCDNSAGFMADDAYDCDDSAKLTAPGLAKNDSLYSAGDNGNNGTCMKDSDGDLHGDDTTPTTANSLFAVGDDCDDDAILTYLPNSNAGEGDNEVASDGIDQDCNLYDSCYPDDDKDGYGDAFATALVDSSALGGTYASPAASACDDAANQVADDAQDCHDNVALANPGMAEVCDGLDTNCDNGGEPPNDEIDNDTDGFVECVVTTSYFASNEVHNDATHQAVSGGGDCVDVGDVEGIAAIDINPGQAEDSDDAMIGDLVDNDCDYAYTSTSADNYHNPAGDECYVDGDQDGHGDATATVQDTGVQGCFANEGEAGQGLFEDCNDEDQTVNPDAAEVCDGQDNDCDNVIPLDETDDDGDFYIECCPNDAYLADNSLDPKLLFSYDTPADLVGGAAYTACENFNYAGSDPKVQGGGDCDDTTNAIGGTGLTGADVFPAHGNEVCEGGEEQVDNDCNGDQNSYYDATINPGRDVDVVGDKNFYPDADGDGFGDENAASERFCSAPAGYDSAPVDCDDRDIDIFPGQAEFCNGRDDDCDGAIDNDDAGDIDPDNSGCLDYYRDSDGDLFGDELQVECLCATDRCSDGEDNDNDGVADADDPDCDAIDGDEVAGNAEKYVTAGLDFVEFSNYFYISRQFDCYDLDSDIFPDSGVTRNAFDVITNRVETLDGHDNDCDGLIAVAELDCDGDGSLAMLPLPQPSTTDTVTWDATDYLARLDSVIPSRSFDDASAIGLPRCDTTMKVNYQLPPTSISCWPNAAKLNLECDDSTGLWMVSYQTDDGQGGIYDGGHHEFLTRQTDGDCDDTCSQRFPGGDEICDGIDNDCVGAETYFSSAYDETAQLSTVLTMERDGVPDSMDSSKEHIGTVTTREFDMDGDGFIGCGDYIGSLNEQVVQTSATCDDVVDVTDATLLSDCNNFCALSTPVAEEACNGFDDLCYEGLEGTDGDLDNYRSCGAWSLGSGADFQSEYYVLAVVNTAGTTATDTADTGLDTAAPVGWPAHMPTVIPLFEPRPIYVNTASSAVLAATCDDPLQSVLDEVYASYTGPSGEDWMLEFCSCVEGLDNTFGDCSQYAATAECVVVKVGVKDTDDQEIQTLVNGVGNEAQGWPNAETFACANDYPEQVVTRSVWNPERILESRDRVVEWECQRLYGYTCTELAANPDLAQTVNPAGTLGETTVNAEITRDAPAEWPVTFGRYNMSVVSEGNLLGCWGDPTTDGLEAVETYIGGDCDNSDARANRYELEGPADLYGVWRSTLPRNHALYLDVGELDCRTCLDNVDNNCDGQADCDDPACAPCFVGQGFGFGSGGTSPCAQPGCQQVAAAPSATRGFAGLALLAAGVVLTGLVGRRKEEDEAPAAK
jgi:hypothetical protein